MGTKLLVRLLTRDPVLEQCNSIWVQNGDSHPYAYRHVLEQCNSIWVQNYKSLQKANENVLEQCNSIWVQNTCTAM